MKNILRTSFLVAGLTLASITCAAPAVTAGYVDFSSFLPSGQGRFVEVKIDAGLLKFAAKIAEKHEPEAAALLKRIKHVHVNVVGLDENNRGAASEKIAAVRQQLEAAGWMPTVNVHEPEKGQEVAVYIKSRADEAIEGIVVTVIDHNKEAVFVNVVGEIQPEQLSELTARFNIDSLKGLDLKSGKLAKNDR
ncbi:MAG: DUF4252 domain-containing protein [Opitutaceae bacterium]|nr:DUF4252 domain-containing protein [Opitutaceae bacterium]MBP9914012.1 DUF4252 domain-containing protein [Opitutaceae bacterium]